VTLIPRFTSRDRTTGCQISPTSLIIETTTYGGFESFLSTVGVALDAIAGVDRPDGVTRVGLRYVDEIRVPGITEAPGDWRGYVDEHLLAPVAEEFVTAAGLIPRTWQGVVQYGTGRDRAVLLRYGPAEGYAVPPGGPTRRKDAPPSGLYFLLDLDSYWQPVEEIPEFDPAPLLDTFRELHVPAKALFDTIVTERLRDEVFRQPFGKGGVE
ncbi:MAG: TIGR04255 family protein, partial [Actinomycetota bacterium]|nr:TIGR04255 family protein [Actinomycetota bacterium]